jgi:hypothetical protein
MPLIGAKPVPPATRMIGLMLPFGALANLLLAVAVTVGLAAAASSWWAQDVHAAQTAPVAPAWPQATSGDK